MYTYLLLNLFTIAFPLFRSFENKIHYARNWGPLFTAITFTGSFFLIWDHYFTTWGVWGFNPQYILGLYMFALPLEEWLFFITVPFACVFIYEVLNYFVKHDPLLKYSHLITIGLVLVLFSIAVLNLDKLYTSVTFILTALFLTIHWLCFKRKYLGKFYLAYTISLFPFLIVNGILTSLPIVVYNDAETLGIRIFTIPLEDTVYCMLLLLMNITLYEFVKEKTKNVKQK